MKKSLACSVFNTTGALGSAGIQKNTGFERGQVIPSH